MKKYTYREVKTAQRAALRLLEALQVLVLDRRTRAYLTANDPKALEQATRALDLAGQQSAPEPLLCGRPIDAAIVAPCEKPAGHAGPCRAFSLETGGTE